LVINISYYFKSVFLKLLAGDQHFFLTYVKFTCSFCCDGISGTSLSFRVNSSSFFGMRRVSALFDENCAEGYLQLLQKTRGSV
jgi:hypothetical protein